MGEFQRDAVMCGDRNTRFKLLLQTALWSAGNVIFPTDSPCILIQFMALHLSDTNALLMTHLPCCLLHRLRQVACWCTTQKLKSESADSVTLTMTPALNMEKEGQNAEASAPTTAAEEGGDDVDCG